MILVGALLLILGFVFVHLLTVLGVVLLVIGAVMCHGLHRPPGVAGRRNWYRSVPRRALVA